jgi:hypothetical protein
VRFLDVLVHESPYFEKYEQKNVYRIIADLSKKSKIDKYKDNNNIDSSALFDDCFGKDNPEFVESKKLMDSLPLEKFYDSVNINY